MGFTDDAAVRARRVLESHGLTRPHKQRISSAKLDRAPAVLETAPVRHCGSTTCQGLLSRDPRARVLVEVRNCQACEGSNNTRGAREMVAACEAAGLRRVLIVGGIPRTAEALEAGVGSALDLRFVSGTEGQPTQRRALEDCRWADLLVVWAPTPLPHKVSRLYTTEDCRVDKVEVRRRGVEALAHAVADHLTTPGNRRVAHR